MQRNIQEKCLSIPVSSKYSTFKMHLRIENYSSLENIVEIVDNVDKLMRCEDRAQNMLMSPGAAPFT